MNEIPALRLDHVVRRYPEGDGFLEILCGAETVLWPGQAVALVAPSGAGKSTLLHIAGLLEKPDSGEVTIEGEPTSGMADRERTSLRRSKIGFVYQFHHLLPEFTALENVMTPQMIAGLLTRRGKPAGVGIARLSWPGSARKPSAVHAFGGRAAACRHRPRRRQCALAAAGG